MLRHSLLCPSVVNLALDVIYVVVSRYNRTPHTKAVYRQNYIKKKLWLNEIHNICILRISADITYDDSI